MPNQPGRTLSSLVGAARPAGFCREAPENLFTGLRQEPGQPSVFAHRVKSLPPQDRRVPAALVLLAQFHPQDKMMRVRRMIELDQPVRFDADRTVFIRAIGANRRVLCQVPSAARVKLKRWHGPNRVNHRC